MPPTDPRRRRYSWTVTVSTADRSDVAGAGQLQSRQRRCWFEVVGDQAVRFRAHERLREHGRRRLDVPLCVELLERRPTSAPMPRRTRPSPTMPVTRFASARASPSAASYSGYFVSVTATGAWSIIRIDNGSSQSPTLVRHCHPDARERRQGRHPHRRFGRDRSALHASSGWAQVLSYDTSSDAVRYTSAGRLAVEFRAGALDDFGGGTLVAPANTQAPSVSGTVAVGQQLQASAGSWTGDAGADLQLPVAGLRQQRQQLQPDPGRHREQLHDPARRRRLHAQGGRHRRQQRRQQPGRFRADHRRAAGAAQHRSARRSAARLRSASSCRRAGQLDGDAGADLQPTSGRIATRPPPIAARSRARPRAATRFRAPTSASRSRWSSPARTAPAAARPPPPRRPSCRGRRRRPSIPRLRRSAARSRLASSCRPTRGAGRARRRRPSVTSGWTATAAATTAPRSSGATASSYTIQSADGGFALEVVVTGSNSAGSSQAASAPTTVVPRSAGAGRTREAPSVSGHGRGRPAVAGERGDAGRGRRRRRSATSGRTATAAATTAARSSGATASSYTIQSTDVGFTLEVVVTGSNSARQQPGCVCSDDSRAAGACQHSGSADQRHGRGRPAVAGEPGDLDGHAGADLQLPVAGLRQRRQQLQPDRRRHREQLHDPEHRRRLHARGGRDRLEQRRQQPGCVRPDRRRAPQAPARTRGCRRSAGTVAVGQQLQASAGTWTGTPAPTFTYQWQDCDSGGSNCVPIAGATASSYTIQSADGGFALEVVVTGSNSGGSSQAASAPTAVVPAGAGATRRLPQISGTVAVGQQLQASPGTWTGTPAPTFTYQWQDCDSGGNNCSPIPGATASSYTIQAGDGGDTLEVVVTGSNSAGSSQAASSSDGRRAAGAGQHQAPQISGTVAVGQQLQTSSG